MASDLTGNWAHSEGRETKAIGDGSHTEGGYTIAGGRYSHSEGNTTKALNAGSHAEGTGTIAKGVSSHTEGNGTEASGGNSHAEGYHTKAIGTNQHVQGRWNIDSDQYAHIVGNGTEEARSNAHTLDWDGNAWFKGEVYVGGRGEASGNKLAKTGETANAIVKTAIGRQNVTITDISPFVHPIQITVITSVSSENIEIWQDDTLVYTIGGISGTFNLNWKHYKGSAGELVFKATNQVTIIEVTYNADTSKVVEKITEDLVAATARAETAASKAEESVQKILNSYVYYDSDKEGTWITGTASNTTLGSGETQKEAFASIGGFRGYSNWAKTSIAEEDGRKVMKFTSGNTESDAQWRILGYAFNENGIYSSKYRKVTLSFRLDPTRSSVLADRATQIWEGVYVQSVRGLRSLNVGISGLGDSSIEDDSVVLYWYSKGFGTLYGSVPEGKVQAIALLDYWLESSDDGFIDVEYYYKAEVLNNADTLTPIAFKVNGGWQTFSPDNGSMIINNMGNTSAEELCFENFRHNAGEYPVIAVPAKNREGTTLAYRKIKYEGLVELPPDLPQYGA